MLIAIDGIHGSGKTSLVSLLRKKLELMNLDTYVTSWDSDERIYPIISDYKREKKLQNPLVYSMLRLANFSCWHDLEIIPRIKEGYIVIADRYTLTPLVMDTMRGLQEERIEVSYSFALKPDVSFLLDIPVEISLSRHNFDNGLWNSNTIWKHGMGEYNHEEPFNLLEYSNYLEKSRNKYLEYAKKKNYIILDGTNFLEKNVLEIIKYLKQAC